MKQVFFSLFFLFITVIGYAQKEKYKWAYYTVTSKKDNYVTNNVKNNSLILDRTKCKIIIPLLNISFVYTVVDHFNGFTTYANSDYGQLMVADNKTFARFEYYTGSDKTFDFNGLKLSN